MNSVERHTEALDDDCEKYLAENGMYSIADHLDETDPVDIFTTDGKTVVIQVPKDISVYYLMRLINHGREQYEAGLAGSGKELDEADRRAGCAERKSANLQDTLDRLIASRRKMKHEAGYDDNVSFDVVWSEIFAKSNQTQTVS